MTITNDPITASSVDLGQALLADLQWVLSSGLRTADAEVIPTLAELALANGGDAEDCVEAVERLLLDEALCRLPRYGRFSKAQLGKGIAELLGIGSKDWITNPDRLDNAAAALTGYASGETFRQSKRDVHGKPRRLTLIFLELVVSQLLDIADRTGFDYTGRFIHPVGRQLRSITKRDLTDAERDQAQTLVREIIHELRIACEETCQAAVEKEKMSYIATLATAIAPGDTTTERVENLLTWAINYLEPYDYDRRSALNYTFGLDSARRLPRETRQKMIEKTVGIPDNEVRYKHGREADRRFQAVAPVLAELSVQARMFVK